MDFHSLTRKELQALCKKNKIPANITNISMADALKALEHVEGIEELLQPSESQSAQSSIESPEKSEVTSPYVPPTGGRTSRRRNVAKEEPQTLQPMTRSRCTTRKPLAKDAEVSTAVASETPAMAAQPTRRVLVASACRKMEDQLQECAEEEMKGIRMTPAPLEVTSRRRKGTKVESEVKQVYSMRRSVRLAEKNVELLNEVKNETSEILKKDLFMKEVGEKVEMTVKEGSDIVDEVSKITGVDAKTNVEENSQKMDDSEVSSGKKQDISLHFEADDPIQGVKQGTDAGNEPLSVGFETGSELDGKGADKTEALNGVNMVMPLNVTNEVQDSDGSPDVCSSEIEIAAENTKELISANDAGSGDTSADGIVNVSLKSNADAKCYVVEEENEINTIKDIEYGVHEGGLCDEIENLKLEESKKAADEVPCSDAVENVLACIKNSPTKQLGDLDSADVHSFYSAPLNLNTDFPKEIETSGIEAEPSFAGIDSNLTTQVNNVSDNKENIGSGSKLMLTKERVKIIKDTAENVNDLNDLSMRKLSKMLKEKLQITNKSSKNENVTKAQTRPALQVLPENRMVDETQN